MIPDLATLHSRARTGWRRRLAGFLSFGWSGSCRTWLRYETVYLLLAGLTTALLVPGAVATLAVVFLHPSTWPWVKEGAGGHGSARCG